MGAPESEAPATLTDMEPAQHPDQPDVPPFFREQLAGASSPPTPDPDANPAREDEESGILREGFGPAQM